MQAPFLRNLSRLEYTVGDAGLRSPDIESEYDLTGGASVRFFHPSRSITLGLLC